MTRISARGMWFTKWLVPVLVLGYLAASLLLRRPPRDAIEQWVRLILPGIVVVALYFGWKRTIWLLADEVLDAGDYLLVRNHSLEEHVSLTNIMNVSATSRFGSYTKITLRLVTPGQLGSEITFVPISPRNPFARNAVADDLVKRVDDARTRR
jgi:hypothetical protein